MRVILSLFAILLIACLPSQSQAANCKPRCRNFTASLKPSSILPDPNDFSRIGDFFRDPGTSLRIDNNGTQEVKLGFDFQIGASTYTSLFISENGIVSFGGPLTTRVETLGNALASNGANFLPVTSLDQFTVPVIAPFYADLVSYRPEDPIGNVIIQYGQADPYADSGAYSLADLQSALRVTWYGLLAPNGEPIYAQLLLAGDNAGTSSFEFRYGPPGSPGQQDHGALAGFSLGDDAYQISGPFVTGIPTYFEFNDGRLAGNLTAAVPEPGTWLLMIAGFGLAGGMLRRRRPRPLVT